MDLSLVVSAIGTSIRTWEKACQKVRGHVCEKVCMYTYVTCT